MDIAKIFLTPDFYYSIFRVTTPILLAALGALIVDKAGMVNIGLEGIMLFSALCGVLGSAYSKNVWVGLGAAMLAGVALSMLMAYFILHLDADSIICGVAANLFANGGTIFILFTLVGDRGISSSLKSLVAPVINIPLIQNIPFLGEVLSGHNLLTYVAFLLVPLLYFMLYKTRLGLRIRATGESKGAVESVGISSKKIQYFAMTACGILCGLGGAYMSMGYLSWFTKDMIAGRGFIALAAQSTGGGNIVLTMISSLLFGTADSLANSLQILKVPAELVQMLPYIVTILSLAVYSYRIKKKTEKAKA